MMPSFVVPSLEQMTSLAIIGLLGGIGHVLMISASKLAPANLIAPAQYSQIVWAVLLGGLFFGEYPDALAFLGLGIVIAAGAGTVVPVRARKWFGAYLVWPRHRDQVSPPLAPTSLNKKAAELPQGTLASAPKRSTASG
jgi:hypothetical protein